MGIEIVIAAASLAIGAAGAVKQAQAQREARRDAKKAEREQKKARAEQRASNAAQSAAERRGQIREERIRRAKVLQASENTGVSGSSGEIGATSNLGTTLGSNIGRNLGAIQTANNISEANQNAADFLGSAQSHSTDASMWGSVGNLGQSIFSAAGGFNAFKSTPTATSVPSDADTTIPMQPGGGY